jgi:arylsulfatase A-like enzyme
MVSADHGENLGELGIYCDHQTADEHTTHLPLILHWPGLPGGEDRSRSGFHYQIDVMATALELFGAEVPGRWDVSSFAAALWAGNRAAGTIWSCPMRRGRHRGRSVSTAGSASVPTTTPSTGTRR